MNLGGSEILVIIVLALLLLGPDKLPGALRMFGKTMGEIRRFQDMAKTEIEKAMSTPEAKPEQSSKPDSDKPSQPSQATTDGFVSDGIVVPILDEEES